MRVIVTGAGGFAGSHIARGLAKAGHDVAGTSRRPLPPEFLGADVRLIEGDLTDPDLIREPFDALIHCAAEIPARCPDMEKLFASNVAACEALFNRARVVGARSVVFMSSMSHYGRVDAEEVTEDLVPQSPDRYGQSKTRGEERLAEATTRGLFSGLSIRLPGTVGRDSHDNFLSSSRDRILKGERLSGRHPDAMFNNIVHVDDLTAFMDRWIRDPRAGHVATNLAAREPATIRQVFTTLFEGLGKPEAIDYSSDGKPPFRISVERALSLGYAPLTTLGSVRAFARDSL